MAMSSSSGCRSLLKEKKSSVAGTSSSSQENSKKDGVKYRRKENNKSTQQQTQEPENHPQRKSALYRLLHRDKKKTPELPEHGFMPDSRRVFDGVKSLTNTLPQSIAGDPKNRWSSYEALDFSMLASPGKTESILEEVDLLKGTTGQTGQPDNSSVSQRSLSHESISTLTSSDNYNNATDQLDAASSDPKLNHEPVNYNPNTHLKIPTSDDNKDVIREKIKQTDERLNEALREKKNILEKLFESLNKSPSGNPDINSLLFNSFMSISMLTSTVSKSICDGVTNCQDSPWNDGVQATSMPSIKDVVLNLQKSLYLLSEKLDSDNRTTVPSSPPLLASDSSNSISAHLRDSPTDLVRPVDQISSSSQLSSTEILSEKTEGEQALPSSQDHASSSLPATNEVEDNNRVLNPHDEIPQERTDGSIAVWDSSASPTHSFSSPSNSVNIKLPLASRRPTIFPDNLQSFDASKILFRRDKLGPLMFRSSSSSCFSDLRIHSSIAEEDEEEEEDMADIQPTKTHPVTAPPTTAPPVFSVDDDDIECTKEEIDTGPKDDASYETPLLIDERSDNLSDKGVDCNEIEVEVENLSLFISEDVDEIKRNECFASSVVEKSCDEKNKDFDVCVDDDKDGEDAKTDASEPTGDRINQPREEIESEGFINVTVDDSSTVSHDTTNLDKNGISFNDENDQLKESCICNILTADESSTIVDQCRQGDGEVSCQEKVGVENVDMSREVEIVRDVANVVGMSTDDSKSCDQENSYDNLNRDDNKNDTDETNCANEVNSIKNDEVDEVHTGEDAVTMFVDESAVESRDDGNESFVQINHTAGDHHDDDNDDVDDCAVSESNLNENNNSNTTQEADAAGDDNDLACDKCEGVVEIDSVEIVLSSIDEDRVRNAEACGSFGGSIDEDEADDGSGNALSSANDEVSTPDDPSLVSCLNLNRDEGEKCGQDGRQDEGNAGASNVVLKTSQSSAVEISNNKKSKARKRKKKKLQQQNLEKKSTDSKSLKDICKNEDSSNAASSVSR